MIPGLAKELPKITNGGKTYTMFLRKGLKYSNGEPIKAGDFKFAVERCFLTNSGGSPFYTDIVGAEKFAKTKKGGISGIKINEKTGKIVINLVKPQRHVHQRAGADVRRAGPAEHAGEGPVGQPAPGLRPLHDHQVEAGPRLGLRTQPGLGKDNGKADAGNPQPATSTRSKSKSSRNQSTQVNEIESDKLNWIFDPLPPDRYQEVKEKLRRHPVQVRADDLAPTTSG